MVSLSVDMLVPPRQAREVTTALSTLARRARHDRSCLHADVLEALDNRGHLHIRSDWSDERALAQYVRSDDFTQLLVIVDMAAEPPALEFRLGGITRGLDYVAEIRAA